MREIKFRAWNGESIKIFGFDDLWADCCFEVGVSFDGTLEAFEDLEIMQYIGLKDKNGKEIYESDFVDHPNGIKVVNWVDSLAAFDMGMSNFVSDQEMSMCYMDEITVIGNIYENPELLNE